MRFVRLSSLLLPVVLLTVPLVAATGEMAKVTEVIDGNTLHVQLRNQPVTIRLTGIATPDPKAASPELQKLGTEATEFLDAFLKKDWVYLEYPTGTQVKNPDGSIDAFVYRAKDGAFVNEKLITDGWGIMNRKQRCIYSKVFAEQEQQAQKNWRGVWNPAMVISGREAGGKNGTNAVRIGSGPDCGGLCEGSELSNTVRLWILLYR